LTSDLRVRGRGSTEAVDRRTDRGANAPAEPGAPELLIEVEPHNCFACGALNEGGLQLDLHVDGDRCWTSIALDDRFQGWDGIAHGGIVCTILDEVMAWSLAASDNWGLTARLNVAFRRPVPLGRPIRAEGWITTNRRRMIATGGRIVDPATGEVLATAEATYVAADQERKRQLQARYRFRLVPDAADRGAG
jgi:acyl-coenzyme A thioesterase PaaI-like protein